MNNISMSLTQREHYIKCKERLLYDSARYSRYIKSLEYLNDNSDFVSDTLSLYQDKLNSIKKKLKYIDEGLNSIEAALNKNEVISD